MNIEETFTICNSRTIVEDLIYTQMPKGADIILMNRDNFEKLFRKLHIDNSLSWDGTKPISEITEFYYPCTDVKIKSHDPKGES